MSRRDIDRIAGVGVAVLVLLFVISLFLAIVRALLPVLVVLGAVGGVWWLWNRYQLQQRQQQIFLSTTFELLLQEHQGRITVFEFAMRTHLKPNHAKQYLDEWATACSAHFEVSDNGDVLYYFPPLKSTPPPENGLNP